MSDITKDISPYSTLYQIIPYFLEKYEIKSYLEIHNQNNFSGILHHSHNNYYEKLNKKDNLNLGVWQEKDSSILDNFNLDYEFIFINIIKYKNSYNFYEILKKLFNKIKLGTTIIIAAAMPRYSCLVKEEFSHNNAWLGTQYEACINFYDTVKNTKYDLKDKVGIHIVDGHCDNGFMYIKKNKECYYPDNGIYNKFPDIYKIQNKYNIISCENFLSQYKIIDKFKPKNIKNNLFVVIGCLRNKDASMFSYEDRVYATKQTFNSIIKLNKQPTIIYFDPSVDQNTLDNLYGHYAKKNNNFMIFSLSNTETPNYIGNKQFGEISSTFNAIKIINELIESKKITNNFDNIFKITGRYNINTRFDENLFMNNNYPVSGVYSGILQTFFYRVRSLDDWHKAISMAYDYMQNKIVLEVKMPMWGDKPWVEALIPYCFGGAEQVCKVPYLGCTGFIAPGGHHYS